MASESMARYSLYGVYGVLRGVTCGGPSIGNFNMIVADQAATMQKISRF